MTERPLIPDESLILCHSSCHGVRLVIDAFHLSKYFNFRKRKIVVLGDFRLKILLKAIEMLVAIKNQSLSLSKI